MSTFTPLRPLPPAAGEPMSNLVQARVRVVASGAGRVWVAPLPGEGCSACQARPSCAVGGLAALFGAARTPIAVDCAHTPRPGEELVLGVRASELLRAGVYAYLLPALLAVVGAVLASALPLGEAAAVCGMLGGGACGLLIARRVARISPIRVHPFISSPSHGDHR